MVLLLWRTLGRLNANTMRGYGQIALAGGVMAATMAAAQQLLAGFYGPGPGQALLFTTLVALPGVAVYGLLLWRMRLPELALLAGALRQRLGSARR